MKISELSRKTGVSKETIHFYMREGLLPPPVKTSPNMAYYDDSHVERIRAIKRLQGELRLQLSEIKEMIEGEESLFRDGERLTEMLSHEPTTGVHFSEKEFEEASGLSPGEIVMLLKEGIIAHAGDGKEVLSESDLEIARAYKGIIDAGYPSEYGLRLLTDYREKSGELARTELKEFMSQPLFETDTGEIASAYKRAEPHLERSLLLLRHKALGMEMRHLLEDLRLRASSLDREYRELVQQLFLSPDYLEKLGIPGLMRTLKAGVRENPEALEGYKALQLLYYAQADGKRLLELSKKAAELAPRDEWVLLYLAMGYGLTYKLEEALETTEHVVNLYPKMALAHCWTGSTLLIKASRENSVVNALALIRGALKELDRANELETRTMAEYLMLHVARGRILCLLPRFYGRFEEGLDELEEAKAVAEREKEQAEDPFYLALLDATLINFYYFLGEAYEEEGRDADRDRVWGELLEIDPENSVMEMLKRRMTSKSSRDEAIGKI